jgi:hypothetical protein
MRISPHTKHGIRRNKLTSRHAWKMPAESLDFPLPLFEKYALKCIQGIRLTDFDPSQAAAEEKLLAQEARLHDVQKDLADALKVWKENPGSRSLARGVTELEAEETRLQEEVVLAKARAATPLAQDLETCQDFSCLLAKAPNKRDTALRIRNALKRLFDGVWILVVGDRKTKTAFVQFWHEDGNGSRAFRVDYTAGGGGLGGQNKAVESYNCLESDEFPFDLRQPDHVKEVERRLLEQAAAPST